MKVLLFLGVLLAYFCFVKKFSVFWLYVIFYFLYIEFYCYLSLFVLKLSSIIVFNCDMSRHHCNDWFCGSIKIIIIIMTKLKRGSKFTDNRPDWYDLFLKRHPDLSQRIAQNLTSGRARVSELDIRNWFHEISKHFKKNNLIDVANDQRAYSMLMRQHFSCVQKTHV